MNQDWWMGKIIVNADDFGINTVVTSEIERQIETRLVSSTTVMANGACLGEVKLFAAEHSEISFGVHLCLSEFDSLTKSNGLRLAGLTDESGKFIHKAVFGLKNLSDETVRKAIREELNAQIDTVESLGFPISHADSHHHVHTIWPLREVFAEVLRSRGIKKVRLGGDFRTMRMRLHLCLWLQRNKLNKYYQKLFTTTEGFYSYAEFIDAGWPVREDETVELMCHPGHPGMKFRAEIERMKQTKKPDGIQIISYNEL